MTTQPRVVRAALTQTVNAYRDMPARLEDLPRLAERLDDVRRANVDHHVALLNEASRQGVQAVCFGELFPAPYFALTHEPLWLALAEDAETGETVTRLRAEARRLGLLIVAPIYELDPSGVRFNTAVVIDERGQLLGKYRKAHIPHGRNEQGAFLEGFYYERSDGKNGVGLDNVSRNPSFPVWQTSFGRLGVAICYDRHFEGVVWSLAHEGAELLFPPRGHLRSKEPTAVAARVPGRCGAPPSLHRRLQSPRHRAPVEPALFRRQPLRGSRGPAAKPEHASRAGHRGRGPSELGRADPSGWDLARDLRHELYSRRT